MQIPSTASHTPSRRDDAQAATTVKDLSTLITRLQSDNAYLRNAMGGISNQLQQLLTAQTTSNEAQKINRARQEEASQLQRRQQNTEWRKAVSAAEAGDYTLLAASEKAHQKARAGTTTLYCDHFTAFDNEYPPWVMKRLHDEGKMGNGGAQSIQGTDAGLCSASAVESSVVCRPRMGSNDATEPWSSSVDGYDSDDSVDDTDPTGGARLDTDITTAPANAQEWRQPTLDELLSRFSTAGIDVWRIETDMRENRAKLVSEGQRGATVLRFREAVTKQQALRREIKSRTSTP
jgi:hypothetical protein